MSFYIQELKAEAERLAAEAAARAEADSLVTEEAARDRLRPLADRLAGLLATIPPGVQRAGLSIPELQPFLRGRRGAKAHQGEIAAALRQRGWVNRRGWSKGADGFRSRWYPPGAA